MSLIRPRQQTLLIWDYFLCILFSVWLYWAATCLLTARRFLSVKQEEEKGERNELRGNWVRKEQEESQVFRLHLNFVSLFLKPSSPFLSHTFSQIMFQFQMKCVICLLLRIWFILCLSDFKYALGKISINWNGSNQYLPTTLFVVRITVWLLLLLRP